MLRDSEFTGSAVKIVTSAAAHRSKSAGSYASDRKSSQCSLQPEAESGFACSARSIAAKLSAGAMGAILWKIARPRVLRSPTSESKPSSRSHCLAIVAASSLLWRYPSRREKERQSRSDDKNCSSITLCGMARSPLAASRLAMACGRIARHSPRRWARSRCSNSAMLRYSSCGVCPTRAPRRARSLS